MTDPGPDQSGNVVINYKLTDPASDYCEVWVWYGTSGTGPWIKCASASVSPNPEYDISSSPAGLDHSFVWDTYADLGVVKDDIWIKVVADDGAAPGEGITSASFTVNNNETPSVTFVSSGTVLFDEYAIIPITYRLYDLEEDACAIELEYSIDAGATWPACTEYPEMASEGMIGLSAYMLSGEEQQGEHLFLWNS